MRGGLVADGVVPEQRPGQCFCVIAEQLPSEEPRLVSQNDDVARQLASCSMLLVSSLVLLNNLRHREAACQRGTTSRIEEAEERG